VPAALPPDGRRGSGVRIMRGTREFLLVKVVFVFLTATTLSDKYINVWVKFFFSCTHNIYKG